MSSVCSFYFCRVGCAWDSTIGMALSVQVGVKGKYSSAAASTKGGEQGVNVTH